MPPGERSPRELPEEESTERKEGETSMEHFERLRRMSGSADAKISREEAESGAVRGGKRNVGVEKKEK